MAGFILGQIAGQFMKEMIDTIINGVLQGISMIPIMLGVALLIIMRDLVLKMIELLPKLIYMALELLDPFNFIKDAVFGAIIGIQMLISGLANLLMGKAQQQGENLPGFKNGLFPGGILGGDNSNPSDEVKCIKPTTIRLLLMVLCPPFAIFMKYGLFRGWLWIIISVILTYNFYYFPGLIFSALHTMCF